MQQTAGDAPARTLLLTAREVASLIKVDKSTVYRLAEAGRLPAVKVGRQWRFPEDLLLEWLGRRPNPAGPTSPAATGWQHRLSSQAGQALAAVLGELLGVMVLLTDMEGRPVAEAGNPCGLFTAVHRYPGVLERCVSGWREMADEPDLEPRWQTTPLGFLCARTLVRVGDQLKGMVLAGGIAPPHWPPAPPALEELAAGLGVPVEAMAPHLDEVHRLTLEQQQRVLRLLPRLGALVSHLVRREPSLPDRAAADAPTSDDEPKRSEL